jgi:hypothetical protein
MATMHGDEAMTAVHFGERHFRHRPAETLRKPPV